MKPKKYPNFHDELFVTHSGYPTDCPTPAYSRKGSSLKEDNEEFRGYYSIYETPEGVLKERADGPMLTATSGHSDPTKERYVGHYVLKEILAIRGKPEIRRVKEEEIFMESI